MEDVAAVLNQVAGGLQQSFGTVFERVGQSLEQSGQMMHMMNAMMEAAMLQNLVVAYDVRPATHGSADEGVDAARFTLHVTVENRSQINVLEASVGVRIGGGAADSPASEERALEHGLCAKSTDAVTFGLEQGVLGHEGTLLLRVRSPGTQEWLEKQVPFRIPVLKIARIEAVATTLLNQEGLIQAHSDGVSVHLLREALGVSAFDALLIASVGYYRLLVPAGVFTTGEVELAILIHRTGDSPSGVRVAVLTPATDDPQRSQDQCRLLLEELESL